MITGLVGRDRVYRTEEDRTTDKRSTREAGIETQQVAMSKFGNMDSNVRRRLSQVTNKAKTWTDDEPRKTIKRAVNHNMLRIEGKSNLNLREHSGEQQHESGDTREKHAWIGRS